ncbi:MAG: PEGA domain-containing protein [Deltaproteobacteria bacterium]|nr:PEGA domain-containing protein [Deltaproteobacteria bacterium]
MLQTILLLALLAAEPSVSAANKQHAQQLLGEGSDLYDVGKIAAALAKFQAAFAAYASPKILFNIGQAHRDLGNPVDAIAAFDRFISGAPDADPALRNEAKRYIAELHTQVGWIEIEGAPDDANVAIDGVLRGRTPIYKAIPVEPGTHSIDIGDEPHRQRRTATTRPGQTAIIRGEALPVAPVPTLSSSSVAVTDEVASVAQPRQFYTETWFMVGAGATVVAGLVAIFAGTSAGSKFDELKSTCGRDPQGCSDDKIDAVTSRASTANVFWVLSGVAAAATGVGVYLHEQEQGVSMAVRF